MHTDHKQSHDLSKQNTCVQPKVNECWTKNNKADQHSIHNKYKFSCLDYTNYQLVVLEYRVEKKVPMRYYPPEKIH